MNKQKNNSNKDNFLKQYWNNFFKYVTMGAISADLLMNISLNYSALKKHDSLQEIPLRIEYMINELENSEKLNYEELNY
ncbi:hypothetical protein K9L67_05340, partial [Candidatus Woesearchaeota archaeon]|nr:hypothetical protein [Candidatus Woesearchaeota archaeon]